MRTFILRLGLIPLLFTDPALALDEPGQDLPYLGRYPGSVIDGYKTAHYDEITVPLGPLGENGLTRSETVEGQVTYIRYNVPEDRSPLEFIRNYQQALRHAGFQILWQCANLGCRTNNDAPVNTLLWRGAPTNYQGNVENFLFENGRMLTAEHHATDGVRTLIFINDNTLFGHSQIASVYSVQTRPMQGGVVSSDAGPLTSAGMADALAQRGRFTMHLPFDFNQATLRADAQPTIMALFQLMQQHSSLRVRLDGHTDLVGTATYNQQLSLNRALAVKSALTAQGIESRRIEVTGYGASRPVASNSTDDGRAKNRRVEVVDLTPGTTAGLRPTRVPPPQTIAPATTDIPGAALATNALDTARSETSYQIQQGVRNLIQGVFGN